MPPPVGVGAIVGTSFRVWARRFFGLTLLTLVAYLPLVGVGIVLGIAGADGTEAGDALLGLAAHMLTWVAAAAITYAVVQELRGQRAAFGRCLGVAFGRIVTVLGIAIVVGVLVALGFLLLVVPGLFLLCTLFVAVPAGVVERTGVFASLARSATLTRGARFRIFLAILVVAVLGMLLFFFWAFLVIGLQELIGKIAAGAIGLFLLVGLATLEAVMVAVTYHLLRAAKEGTTADDLARVFE